MQNLIGLAEYSLKANLIAALLEDRKPQPDYERRYMHVINAMLAAKMLGIQAGIRIDPKEPDWPVVFIELPTGQVSWHIEQHAQPWDNHSTEQKIERVKQYLDSVLDN